MQPQNPQHRNLTPAEIQQLRQQGNHADDWSSIFVSQPFSVECVRDSIFEGTVTLGPIECQNRLAGDLPLREGIYHSTLRDCTVGSHPAIHSVRLLCGYSLGDNVTLFNVGQITCNPDQPVWLEPMNENGGRRIIPFPGMTIADAYLWARYRGRKTLMAKLEQYTRDLLSTPEHRYGQLGDHTIVTNTQCLHNIVVRSSADDPSAILNCITLRDGVVGYGCTLEHGIIAERFLLGEHVHLEFGLRLNDTVVGDNSTLARCEVGNSIIFPAHEQHHNNSFLIAALVMGQSNIAAGATIGSNHNSRTPDNELAAGRGFWPGLCASFKHSSRFASYCLLAKADYPSELDITLPFALVNNNVAKDRLEVMPAYWWMYNMYAMDRNSKKFAKRDKRKLKAQHIEFDNLAPDTAEEILHGMRLLRSWIAAADSGTVYAAGMEKSHRPTVVLKAAEGLRAYEEMLVFYAMKYLTAYGNGLPAPAMQPRCTQWVNIGGQLVAQPDVEHLIADVESGAIDSWQALNNRLDDLWQAYPAQRDAHAYGVLCELAGTDRLDEQLWHNYLQRYDAIQAYIEEQKQVSRHKDDINPFRHMTYWDDDERNAVL